jgi:Tetratricopeptide repeat
VLARVAVAFVAVAMIGWLAVMERDARLYARGIAAGGSLDDPNTIARADADLRDARLLSPDRTPDVGRALILWTTGRTAEARAVLESVVSSEPDNLSAWTALGWVNGGADPALERRVATEMRRLDPLSGGRRPARPARPPQAR